MKGKRQRKLITWNIAVWLMFVMLNSTVHSSIPINEIFGTPAEWTDDIRLTNNSTSDDSQAIAVNVNNLHVVWSSLWLGRQIYYTNSTDYGETWSPRNMISLNGFNCNYPDIGLNTSQIHVVWDDNDAINHEIKYRNSTDGGITWNSIIMISEDDGLWSSGAKIAVHNSNIHAIWVDDRFGGAQSEIYYRRSIDCGITWDDALGTPDTDRRITHDLSDVGGINIGANGSNLHVLYNDIRDGSADVYYIRSTDNGVTWDDGFGTIDEERKLTSNATSHSVSAIAVNGSTIHVVWVDQEPGPIFSIYYRNSTDNGATWGAIQQLVSPFPGTAYAPNLAVQNDVVHMTWHDMRDGGQPEIYYKNSTDSGATWSSDLRLTELDGFSSGGPKIVLSGSQKHIIWQDQRDGNKEIYYKRFPEVLPDSKLPEINHAPVPSANIDEIINVTANITDNFEVNQVYLNYTDVNGINHNVSMTQWNGNWSYDIPGQDNIGVVSYFIWCNDTNDNTNQTPIYQIQINDVTDPEIHHVLVASANVFDVINITANITDYIAVNFVFLNYTGVNGTNCNVSMNKWDGNYSYDIPGQAETGIIEYFIWANDTSGNDNMTSIYQIQINDITKPEINHTPVVSKNIGEFINITVNITDDIEVNKVSLDYTGVNGTHYNISINQWGGNWSYEIPGQSNSGFVSYFIWANDTSDNDNQTTIYQIQIFDITDPEINHVPVTSVNISETINITANVTDDVSVNFVYLNYTGVNGTSYNVSMQKWNGNYSYEIPGQAPVGVINYFIWANDTNGNDNRTMGYSIQINDIVKPEINHVPVMSANIGELINITVNVTDDVKVDKVYLNYTGVDGINHNVTMSQWDGNWSYEITGQDNIGVVDYFIWVNDTSGNDNQTQIYQIQINDITKPEIEHTPITSVNVSEVINITVQITDDIEVDSVYLNYTDIDGINHNVSMSKWIGNWSYEIPGQASAGTIEYFIWANDTSGNDNRTIENTIQINENIIPDITPPTIISTSPTGINVSISTTITITFDEPMNISSVQNAITISPAITISDYNWNADNTTLTITLSGNLSYNTTYNVTVGIGAKDIAENNLASVYSWEFTTELQPVINNPDGGIGEYWRVILVLIAAVLITIYLFYRFKKEKEPENINKEP